MGNGREVSVASLHQTVCHSQLSSLWRQNILVDVTSPHIARGCRPMLQLHYRRRSDGWTARYATSMVGCVWEVEGMVWYGIVGFNVPLDTV